MNRRDFLKSAAILGAGISVPLMARDGMALYSPTHPEIVGPPRPERELSEAALEDMLIEIERNTKLLIDPADWFIKPTRLIVHPSWL